MVDDELKVNGIKHQGKINRFKFTNDQGRARLRANSVQRHAHHAAPRQFDEKTCGTVKKWGIQITA